MKQTTEAILKAMTLEEKAALCAGLNMWMTKGYEHHGIPSIHMYDGTNGIRKTNSDEEIGISGQNIPATCYPTGSAIGSSWDVDLLHEIGVALGVEGQEMGVRLLLGPGVNMKRTPLGGRNFEYYSEDPVLTGELGAAFVNGLQNQGVGASVKHFACNNQEYEKMVTSSEVDERTLREIYLSAFERIVKKANPWTMMCSYNLVNGSYASENEHLLHDILREEWGYEGVMLSDWTAVNDRIRGLKAGLDIEMPGPAEYNTKAIVKAVQENRLDEAVLDQSVTRILELVRKTVETRNFENIQKIDYHELARKAASESMVLLKNDHHMLPIDKTKIDSMAVIGTFAKKPRIQGAGSAEVTPTRIDTPWEHLQHITNDEIKLSYADGYPSDDRVDEALILESVAIAAKSDMAVLFVGQPDYAESEMHDLKDIELPLHQVKLIEAVAAVQPNCIVVTSSGTALAMSTWAHQVSGIIHAWLSGQGSGQAIVDILFGRVNPSGKLSETFPAKLSDNPSHKRIRGENGKLFYREGLFVGYRYYDSKELIPQFAFGHGLSYTSFAYSDLKVAQQGNQVHVSCMVENTGDRFGKEVVQLYVHDEECKWVRPEKELKAFAKVALQPGEKKEVRFVLEERDFAYYNTKWNRWVAESGDFKIIIGSSSRDIRLQEKLFCTFEHGEITLHKFSLLTDWLSDAKAKAILESCFAEMNQHVTDQVVLDDGFVGFWGDFPAIKIIQMFGQSWLTDKSPDDVIAQLIAKFEQES
ncbi:glycosyl hydrolase [Paenibacillus selenitireducens]|uniref:Glycosyl hydrolase n=1 Tax=Paenibacillus selenitireducens TaxID=1324314 RepID=A0A1T2XMH6_9BACL|nr:glycoside hydrolase family 3 C-terminal domain-containing protein [Paenibacillus selenitireducens]OPA81015.1 glycosyl hydrolase [Paenibacillus selenitireducens]